MPYDSWSTFYINKDLIHNTIADLETAKKTVKETPKPIVNLIKELEKVKYSFKLFGFFKLPGSYKIINNIDMVKSYADVALKNLNRINLDKPIGKFYELILKIDSLNKYVKELELENERLRKQ